jgi:hypothetical protein
MSVLSVPPSELFDKNLGDAFIAVLNTLPYEDTERSHREDWLEQRIKQLMTG